MVTPAAKLALLILGILLLIILVGFFFKTQISLFINTLLKHRAQTQQSAVGGSSV